MKQKLNIPDVLRRALKHHRNGEIKQAAELYYRVLKAQPANPDALHLLGVIAQQAGDNKKAIALIEEAVIIRPKEPAYHLNLGSAYAGLDRFDEAAASYRRALSPKPDNPEAYFGLGNVLFHQKKTDEAILSYERALSLKPDYSLAHVSLSIVWLLKGDFEKVWKGYAHRLTGPEYAYRVKMHAPRPNWDGSPVKGKTILLWDEQGYGDTIGDKNYDTKGFVEAMRELNVTPHVAQNDKNRSSAIDQRTTRHEGYAISQKYRKRIEEIFGWMKTVGNLRKIKYRGQAKVSWHFDFAAAAYNLVRMRNLGAGPV